MSEWKECKLGDVAEIVGGGTPKTKVTEYWNGNVPWLTPRDLSNFSGRYISKLWRHYGVGKVKFGKPPLDRAFNFEQVYKLP